MWTPVEFQGDRRDVVRSLQWMGAGLAAYAFGAGLVWLMSSMQVISGKGMLAAVILPLLGTYYILRGLFAYLWTSLRFRMTATFFGGVLVLATLIGGAVHMGRAHAAERQRLDAIEDAFRDDETVRPFVKDALAKDLDAAALRGKVLIVVDEETDYNGFQEPTSFLPSLQLGPSTPSTEMRANLSRFADLTLKLPADMQPMGPADVQTVVYVKGIQKVLGIYENTTGLNFSPDYGYQYHAHIKVVDLQKNAIVAETEIVGPEPPAEKKSGDRIGEMPEADILAWLLALPRQ